MAAGQEQAEAVVVGELAEADGVVKRSGRLLLPHPTAAATAPESSPYANSGIASLAELTDVGASAVLMAREEEVLQLALPALALSWRVLRKSLRTT